jgi:hypothetical protein
MICFLSQENCKSTNIADLLDIFPDSSIPQFFSSFPFLCTWEIKIHSDDPLFFEVFERAEFLFAVSVCSFCLQFLFAVSVCSFCLQLLLSIFHPKLSIEKFTFSTVFDREHLGGVILVQQKATERYRTLLLNRFRKGTSG